DVLSDREVRLIVAGEFWEPRERYDALVHDLGLGGRVDIRAGYVPDDELPAIFASADVAVAPYRSATQSGAIEMAFGAGVPVVASKVDGLAEQVDHGVNGLLVAPDDPGALARGLCEALRPDVLERLRTGARAPDRVRSWDHLVADIDDFAASLRLSPGRPGSR